MAHRPPEASVSSSTFCCPLPGSSHLKASLSTFSKAGQPGPHWDRLLHVLSNWMQIHTPSEAHTCSTRMLYKEERKGRKEGEEKYDKVKLSKISKFQRWTANIGKNFLFFILPPPISQTYSCTSTIENNHLVTITATHEKRPTPMSCVPVPSAHYPL